jgi:hypothetical protein
VTGIGFVLSDGVKGGVSRIVEVFVGFEQCSEMLEADESILRSMEIKEFLLCITT